MRLVTFAVPTALGPVERVGALGGSWVIDLTAAYGALLSDRSEGRPGPMAAARIGETMIEHFRGGEGAREAAEAALAWALDVGAEGDLCGPGGERIHHLPDDVRVLAPIPRPTTLRDFTGFRRHMELFMDRTGGTRMPESAYARPMYFKANPGMVRGPGDEIAWSRLGERLDFEIEVAVFVGRDGVDLSPEDARDVIAGFTILNDVTLRDVAEQELALPVNPYGVSKSKDAGGYYTGPCVVTTDELRLDDAEMVVRVNGEEWTRERIAQMTWSFEELVSYASIDEPVRVGDCLAGGAPPHGTGAELGRSVAPGDLVECEVDGIGVLANVIGAPADASPALRAWRERHGA